MKQPTIGPRVPQPPWLDSTNRVSGKPGAVHLVALEYLTESDGVYTAVIPVLTERDRQMVKQLRILGRQAMVKWFDERYRPLCAELDDLTPRRYGVPLSNSFWWVWHYLFAVANRELVAAGLFADPYDSRRKFQGFIPAVYQLDVVQGPF